MKREPINCYDFDGVVSLGITPSKPTDIIITGRTFEEAEHVMTVLKDRKILNAVFFNPIRYEDRGDKSQKSRSLSGKHKANILNLLKANGVEIQYFFEDDPIQASFITESHPEIPVILVKSDLVKK